MQCMQWFRTLLTVVLIDLGTIEGAWRRNQEYNYNVLTKTLSASNDGRWNGIVFKARLTIIPESDELLIGRLSRPQYANLPTSAERADSDLNDSRYYDLPMEQPFNIVLREGVVKALLVDRELNEVQVNQLKFVVKTVMNQLQVHINAEQRMDGNNGAYSVNEQTMMGNCDTVYEIFPLPEYWANRGQYIDIVKSRNYNKCFQSRDSSQTVSNRGVPNVNEVNRIILSGSLDDYTVQSSVSTLKTSDRSTGRLETISNVNVTLESLDTNVRHSPIRVDSFMDVENNYPPRVSRKSLKNLRMMGNVRENQQEDLPDDNGEILVSNCWTWFYSADAICYGDFDAEWAGVGEAGSCGFLDLGRRVKCQRKYRGCEGTACYSFFLPDLCKEFGDRLPVHTGAIDNCVPGFWRYRCCPK